MARVAIYLRVSTTEQVAENQLPVLQKWVADRGHELIQIYSESESAWHSGHQHELAQLKADAARRRFDIVLVWALDRLSRRGPTDIMILIHTLNLYGAKVVSLQEPWSEIPGDFIEIFYAFAGWMAREESKRLSERTKLGLERARKYGGGKRGKDKQPRRREGYSRRYKKGRSN